MNVVTGQDKSRPITNRDMLRHETQRAHTRAETMWFASGSFASRASYDAWLASLLLAHTTLGQSATQTDGLRRYATGETRRRNALLHDLGEIASRHPQSAQPTESWSWGVLYALNGSALGASIILKSGAVKDNWPKDYLEVMRDYATSGQLLAFFKRLNEVKLNTVEMVRGANGVFDVLADQGRAHRSAG